MSMSATGGKELLVIHVHMYEPVVETFMRPRGVDPSFTISEEVCRQAKICTVDTCSSINEPAGGTCTCH